MNPRVFLLYRFGRKKWREGGFKDLATISCFAFSMITAINVAASVIEDNG